MFYIYRFVDKDNKIIYIGKTKQSLRYRFSQHVHLPESCYSRVSRIEYLECQTEADMSMKEIFYINIYRANGLAEYNVSDVSQLPQEISIDEKNDVWKPYMGSLPSVFSHSVNHREKYTEEPKKYIQRYDGRTVKFQQNSITGKEKFVYPIDLPELENLIYHFAEKMKTARNDLYAFYNFRHIVILALGVSSPIKGKDLITLKICDVFKSNGEIKPYIHRSRGEDVLLFYPKTVNWLLFEYYRFLKDIYNKDDNYWLFWGQKDNGTGLTADAYAKILKRAIKELGFNKKLSMESLRKTFLRFIFDSAKNKYEAIACIDFFIQENYRHTPGRVLKYIDILDHKSDFDPVLFVKDKYIMDAISEKCLNTLKDALQSLNHM